MDTGEWVLNHTEGASCFPVQVNKRNSQVKRTVSGQTLESRKAPKEQTF